LLAAPLGAAELEGRVTLVQKGKPLSGLQTVLVYYEPEAETPVSVPDEPFEVVTVRKQFNPRSLIVPVGSRVRFPNQDNILHNAFSLSGKNRFDLGLYRRGDGKETTFDEPGVVRVFCNVHHSMVAYVLVVETPFYTTAAADGSFRFEGLPDGPGRLTVWHERSEPWTRKIAAGENGIDIRVEVSKPRVPRHKNKFGKPYTRRRSGRDYG
jgi:plastocyanin